MEDGEMMMAEMMVIMVMILIKTIVMNIVMLIVIYQKIKFNPISLQRTSTTVTGREKE